jgi:hypothetical protein
VAASFDRMGGHRNPFSVDVIREQQPATFPDAPVNGMTREERKIVANARRDAIAMGYAKAKGELGVQATADIESFVNARFNTTAVGMNRRMEAVLEEVRDPDMQDIIITFTVQNMIRMGAAMTAIADAAEGAIRELVERKLITDEQQSVLAALFRGR